MTNNFFCIVCGQFSHIHEGGSVSDVGTVTHSAQLVSGIFFLLKVVKSLACDSSYPVLVVCHSHVDPRQVGIGTFYTMANSS